MIMRFLMDVGFAGLKNWIWLTIVAGAVALLGVLVAIADRRHENTLIVAQEAGAANAVTAGQRQTLEQLKEANDAGQELRSAGERDARRYADCLRDARNKQRCQRFKPAAE